jgi:hypothetical protein
MVPMAVTATAPTAKAAVRASTIISSRDERCAYAFIATRQPGTAGRCLHLFAGSGQGLAEIIAFIIDQGMLPAR